MSERRRACVSWAKGCVCYRRAMPLPPAAEARMRRRYWRSICSRRGWDCRPCQPRHKPVERVADGGAKDVDAREQKTAFHRIDDAEESEENVQHCEQVRDDRSAEPNSHGIAMNCGERIRAVRASDCGAAPARSRRACRRSCGCLLYTSPSPRDRTRYRMPSSA